MIKRMYYLLNSVFYLVVSFLTMRLLKFKNHYGLWDNESKLIGVIALLGIALFIYNLALVIRGDKK